MPDFLHENIDEVVIDSTLTSYKKIYRINKHSKVKRWVYFIVGLTLIVLLLPWTQNIRSKGSVTTLRQENRPQEINTVISGRVAQWYVKEGDLVKQGDTILKLAEVKVEYFDPNLLNRTKDQIVAKQQSSEGYKGKANTALLQIEALLQNRNLKLQSLDNKIQQQRLKIISDSMDIIAVTNDFNIYKRQLDAGKIMLDSGAISLIDFEKRKANFQTAYAKKISAENDFVQSKQELTILHIEKNSVNQDFADKIAKAEGDKFSSISDAANAEGEIAKLKNLYANYDIRNQLYYVIAPQDGQITKAKKAGINEFIKEGEMIAEIVPTKVQLAVELFVNPMDIPLISKGQKVRFIFDGFPVIVFSGWPNYSYGTFSGVVAAIETNISVNGKFRILVIEDPDPEEKKWPKYLQLGTGAQGIALLKNVPIGYELWRNINGFPPEYYKLNEVNEKKK
ncbi:MAG: HlyD family efflux transporter periplasmic adaptor subunit [Chitinophagaceae bacterium]|nr:HlyD family efflux transporter periplasmic adaptor subunit [Chitinophagaceae bacterium]